MATYTVYPNAIDSSSELPLAVDNVTPVKGEVVNRHRSAILAIEAELGIQPSGVYGTVRARLDDIEARIADLAEQLEALTIASGGSIRVKQDGTTVVVAATTLNFTGGVTVTNAGATADIAITAPGLPSQLASDNSTSGNDILFSSGDNISIDALDGTGFDISFLASATADGGTISVSAQNGNAIGVNAGGNIALTPGAGQNGGVDGYVLINGDSKTNSIILESIASPVYNNTIWRAGSDIYYTNDSGINRKLVDYAAYGPFIAIAGKESSDIVSPNEDGKGCFVLDPTTIDGYTNATFTFNAVLETTDGYLPAEIYLYNITDGYIVDTFSTTPMTTSSIVPVLLQRELTLYTDIPASEKVYQARIRFESGSPTANDIVTCRLAEVRVT